MGFMSVLIVAIAGGIYVWGWRKVPEDPPHKGQRTWLGERVDGEYVDEGWHWFFLYPWVQGFIPVAMKTIPLDVVSEKTRTPDGAESKVPVSMAFTPDPRNLKNYLNNGGEDGVKTLIRNLTIERIREWASDEEEGPGDWKELNRSQSEAVSILAKRILGDLFEEIPAYAQEVPTWIWMRFYTRPQPQKLLNHEADWAKDNWKRVRDVLAKIEADHGEAGVKALEKAIDERKKKIDDLQTGVAKIRLPHLGIILHRLNLGDIDVLGELAKKAEKKAEEEETQLAEALKLKFTTELMQSLMKEPFNFTAQEARDMVQTERGIISRAIDDKRISIDTPTVTLVAKVLEKVLEGKHV